ncbi:carboxy-S-adenosyl-L-methionine synthase CmoA [Candidatus Erwinia haradaeae]|nr:carboxy-S-adenosyl-L-methionine synthase CmoA [Candidatus Erwinia haradaeae]
MFKRDTLLSEFIPECKDWVFNKQVVEVFPDMIQRSIPGYNHLIFMIGVLAKYCVQEKSQVYDLGCSVGTVSIEIQKNITVKSCKIIAIDNSPAMVECCRSYIKQHSNSDVLVEIYENDIRKVSIQNASLVVLNFTLQFLHPDDRQELINNIWKGLNPQGVLVLSEKFHYVDKDLNTLLTNMHDNFKRDNGYSDLEIHQKRCMLEKVMLTDTFETHVQRIQNSGFQNYGLWFQHFNFGSFIALKKGYTSGFF